MLRQQEAVADGKPNLSLADFIAPRTALGAGRTDYLGAFAVTAGLGADDLAHRFEAEQDDYSAILVKALADRLAEAFAAMSARAGAAGIGHSGAPDATISSSPRRIAVYVRGSDTRPVRITPKSSSCSTCSIPPPSGCR